MGLHADADDMDAWFELEQSKEEAVCVCVQCGVKVYVSLDA